MKPITEKSIRKWAKGLNLNVKPEIIERAKQDCGEGLKTIYVSGDADGALTWKQFCEGLGLPERVDCEVINPLMLAPPQAPSS